MTDQARRVFSSTQPFFSPSLYRPARTCSSPTELALAAPTVSEHANTFPQFHQRSSVVSIAETKHKNADPKRAWFCLLGSQLRRLRFGLQGACYFGISSEELRAIPFALLAFS
jgi:hypothetical protein